jgi:hypothetical protein
MNKTLHQPVDFSNISVLLDLSKTFDIPFISQDLEGPFSG